MSFETSTFEQPDGFSTPVYYWPAQGEARAVVMILHGMAEHGARYDETGTALAAAGLAVYAHDHRGHGRAVEAPVDRGFFGAEDSWNLIVQDVYRFSRHLSDQHPDLKQILLGHSMGSFLAQQLMTQHPATFAAVALSGSDGPIGALGTVARQIARAERWRLGPRGRSKLLHHLSFGAFNKPFEPARTEFDWLSREPAVVDAYRDDPLCGFVMTTQAWFDLLGALVHVNDPKRLDRIPKDLPIYVFSGQLDPVSKGTRGLKRLLALYAELGLERVQHRFYPDARHETLNETNREEVRGHLLGWIDEVLKAS